MRIRIAALLLVLALIAMACTSSADSRPEDADGQVPVAGDASGGDAEDPVADVDEDLNPEEIPPLPLLSPDGIAEPGTSVGISADSRLEGEITLIGSDGVVATASMASGVATLSVPADLQPGSYGLVLGEGSAVGELIVLGSPGVALFGTSYWGSNAEPVVEVIVHGLLDGQVAALELTGGDTGPERMAPHDLLGLAPITSASEGFTEGRHEVSLPAGFSGKVRVVVGDVTLLSDPFGEDPPEAASDDLVIRHCDEPSGVVGDLGVEAVITARSSALDSPRRAVAESGRFRLDLPAGRAMISALLLDGSAPAASPQFVRVTCGAYVDVGDLSQEVDSGPSAGDYLGGLSGDELWAYSMSGSGDIEFSHEGIAECWAWEGPVEVGFSFPDLDPLYYTLVLQPPLDTGLVEGEFHIEDFFTGESADGILSGEMEVGTIDDADAMGGAFSGTVEGTLGTIEIELRFVCTGYFFEASAESDDAANVLLSGPVPQSTVLPRLQAGSASDSQCKQLYAMALRGRPYPELSQLMLEYWTAKLGPEVPRIAMGSQFRVSEILGAAEEAQWQDPDADTTELIELARQQLNADFLLYSFFGQVGEAVHLHIRILDVHAFRLLVSMRFDGKSVEEALAAARTGWQQAVEPLRNADICAEVQPESTILSFGETEEFTIEVTNLAGEPAKSPEVKGETSLCGSWDPFFGAVDGTSWSTTFTAGDSACAEKVRFKVTADGARGELETGVHPSVEVQSLWQFETTITLDSEMAHVTATAEGEFFLEDDFGFLIGAGIGTFEGTGTARCEVNGSVSYQDVDLVGTYKVMVSGTSEVLPEGKSIPIDFIPGGFDVNTTATYKQSTPCMEAGTYTNELISWLAPQVLVVFPHYMASKPDGFEMALRSSGEEYVIEEPMPAVPGTTIKIRVWRPNE